MVKKKVDGQFVEVISTGAIAYPVVGDGRLIPCLLLNLSERADAVAMINSHKNFAAGDMSFHWGRASNNSSSIVLDLDFIRPIKCNIPIIMSMELHSATIDQILTARAAYIQAARMGEKLSHNPSAPKIVVELPHTGFYEIWNKRYHTYWEKKLRKGGMDRKTAKAAAKAQIAGWREFGSARIAKPTD